MWIRSQYKRILVNSNFVFCKKYITTFNGVEEVHKYEIYTLQVGYEKPTPLGIYETEERALEVLDEIQKSIIDSNVTQYEYFYTENQRLVEYTYKLKTVYEMPKE